MWRRTTWQCFPHSQSTFLHIIIPSWQLTMYMHQNWFTHLQWTWEIDGHKLRIIKKWTVVCRKVLPKFIIAWSRYFSSSSSTVTRTCGLVCLWDWRSIILPNEQFVSYYGIMHIIYITWFYWEVHTRVQCIHCKCTNMKFENWTSIADGYVSCIHNSWELESPLIVREDS